MTPGLQESQMLELAETSNLPMGQLGQEESDPVEYFPCRSKQSKFINMHDQRSTNTSSPRLIGKFLVKHCRFRGGCKRTAAQDSGVVVPLRQYFP